MADNFSTKISKTLLAHDIKLAQVDAAMRKDVMAVMNALEKKTIDNVMKLGSPASYKSVSAQNKALNLLTTSQAPTTAKAYKQMADVTGVSLTKLAAVESEFVVNSLNRAITVDLGLNKLSPEVIRLLPGKALIEGAPFTTWFKQQAEDFQLKFSNQMREGIVNGETIDDMVRRVRGTKANGFKDGFVSPKKGHAQTLVRSSVQATANKARESVYAANSDVIKGQQWLSTLDSRTSDICISLDGSAWFLSGKPMAGTVHSYLGPPPAHFNCRSTLVPVTKSFSELTKDKKTKEKLRKIPKAKQRGLRASMDGAVSNKLDYEEWLRSKSPGFQKSVLGPTKLRLWQSGQLSLKNLIDQSHNPLAIDALVAETGVPKITLDQALETAATAELPVTAHGVSYKSSKQWYDEFADKDATKASILADEDEATVNALAAIQKKINAIDASDITHKVNGKWTPERQKVHDKIIREFLNKATVAAAKPKPGDKPSYVMFGGRGGSGKGAFTTPKSKGGLQVIDEDRYIILDADAIKGQLPGYEGWNAFHYHAESSELFGRITAIAARLKINVVHDMTMRSVSSATKRSALFAKKGYDMEGYYMFLPPQTASKRAISRFRTFDNDFSGRYVPPEVVLGNTQNEVAFDVMKKKFSKWKFYDNQGDAPVLVGKGGNFTEDTIKPLTTAATKEADAAVKAGVKATNDAAAETAAAAAKAAAKAADDAMAAKLAKEAAEKEAAAAKAAQAKAEKELAEQATLQKEIAEAKEEFIAVSVAGDKPDKVLMSFLLKNTTADELAEVSNKITKAKQAAKALQKEIADAEATHVANIVAGKNSPDDVLDVLVKHLSSDEISALQAKAITAKKAVEAAAKEAAEAAAFTKVEDAAKETVEKFAAQKATFEKRALIKLKKADPDFDALTYTTQLEKIEAQVEIDKAAKKITDGISNYKKAIINGKVPPPAAAKVFNALDPEKQDSIIADIAKKTGQQQAAATPPTLAESLAQYDSGKLSNAEWIEAYNKAKGTYTLDVQKTILSAPDTVLADTAETLAQQAAATVAKAQAPAPGTIKVALSATQEAALAKKVQQEAKALIKQFDDAVINVDDFKAGIHKVLNIEVGSIPENKLLDMIEEAAKELPAAKANVAATVAPTPTFKTVSQIQEEAQDFLDKFRFGEFDEKEALKKALEVGGNASQFDALAKLSPSDFDAALDAVIVHVKQITKSADLAKESIKKQGLKLADDIKPATPPPKPPPPPEPKPVAPAPASPVNAPPNMDELTRIGEQAGSNPGGLFQDAGTGQKWYVKTPGTEEIARNEVLAAKLYEKMGIEVPDLHIVKFNGKPSVASRIVDGLQENSTALRAGEVAGVHEGFVADAFLANWDVVGLGYDNLLVKAGRAIRVDTGGALRFRAQGGLKGNAFGKVVDEIDTLRNPGNNSQSAGVFGRITDAELKAGARKVANLTDADIKGLVQTYGPLDPVENRALQDILIARRNDIKKRFKIRAKKQPPAKPPEDLNADVTSFETQQITDARSNGFVLTRDKDSIEDQAILAWNETVAGGGTRSMLQLKIRGDAVKNLNAEIAKTVQKKPQTIYLAELDGRIEKTVRGLKHRVNTDADFDTTSLVRLNEALEEHERVRTVLQSGLRRGEISKATLDKFDATYDPWVKGLSRMRGQNGVGGKVQGITELPDGRFARDVIGDIELVPKVADKGAEIRWSKKQFDFEEKQLKNGNVIVTGSRVNPVSSGGGWYETKIDDITVRYFARDTVNDNFALQDRLEIIAPGKTHEQALNVIRKLGINVDRATDVNAEELYLRQIMAHATSSSSGTHGKRLNSFISELAGITDESARLDRARKLVSEHLRIPDVTKTAAYNYRGQYQAFGQGQRHLLRPDIDGGDWDAFTDGYRLHHSNTSNSTLPEVIDMVLNSGGNFISTTDKIRRGVALRGMSPDSDLRTGGASYFFTRIKPTRNAHNQAGIVWKSKHVKRLDSISYNHDAYGEVVDDYVTKNRKTGVVEWTSTADRARNETIFKNGLSLFDDLDVIVTSTKTERNDILGIFRKHGLTEWPDGRRLEDVVISKG